MATVRLNNEIRKAIVKNAIKKSGIEKEKLEHEKRRCKFSVKVYETAVGDSKEKKDLVENFIDLYRKMQAAGFRLGSYDCYRSTACLASFGGERMWLNFGQDDKNKTISKFDFNNDKLSFPANHELSEEFRALEKEKKDIDKRYSDIQKSVSVAVDSVTTIKRLLEIWPEAKELLPETMDDSKPSFPAISVESLNAIVGLPSGK